MVGLVNLAGIACTATLHECELAEFDRVMAVNVTGSYLMIKAAAARMIPQGIGRIVNTSSITAFDGGGTFSKGVYATAKAAVIGMAHGGARELGQYGITVNVLAPGPIDTEIMGGQLSDERKASMSAGHSAGPGRSAGGDRRHHRIFCFPPVLDTSTGRLSRSTEESTCTDSNRAQCRSLHPRTQHPYPRITHLVQPSKETQMTSTKASPPRAPAAPRPE